MNENINLCEILRGLKGIELYSSIFGNVILEGIESFHIIVRTDSGNTHTFNYRGIFYGNIYKDAECTIFPSKDQRDWSKYERPIPVNTPVMYLDENSIWWEFGYYAQYNNSKKMHLVYTCGSKSTSKCPSIAIPNYIIPYNKFNPNNIEESLKYNIQK